MQKPIPGYPMYLIDAKGNVFSLYSNKYLKPSKEKTGYLSIELFNKNGSKRLLVHRLVAITYIPNPNNLPMVNHKDENKINNNVNNLEWCTAKYNMNYGTAPKRRIENRDYSKEIFKINARKNGAVRNKKVIQYTKNHIFVHEYISVADAFRQTKIKHISECALNKRHSAGGYKWQFVEE